MTTLCDATLAGLPARVSVPAYDRRALVPSVVHLGVGGFHRAHQALYLDDLAALGETGWGVVGVGLRSTEMGEVLQAQDGLFTVVERGPEGETARVVGSLLAYHYAPDDPEAVLALLAAPQTRLVTLTITGDGYRAEPEEALRDLPRSAMGYLVQGLARRRAADLGPFTVLSCDNLPDSGKAARDAVLEQARAADPDLADWIAEHGRFPSSMVDRITPETSPADRDAVEREWGVPDRWPVIAEPFRQWVVQDDFACGRPPLERVGVRLVDDVEPYKLVKTRVLNAGHSAIGYLGALAGHTTSYEAMADPVIAEALRTMVLHEVLPLLHAPDDLDLEDYVETTLTRFANPAVADTLARLCRRGSVKMPSYLLPSLREAREQGRPSGLLVLATAAWMRALRGTDLAGRPLPVEDPKAEALQALALAGGDDPRPLLGARSVFGRLGDDPALVADLEAALRTLSTDGLALAAKRAADGDLAVAA